MGNISLCFQADTMARQKTAFAAFFGVFILTALLFVVLYALPIETAQRLKAEGGVIEISSALFHFAAAAVLFTKGGTKVWPLVIVLVSFGLREFDMDKVPFTEGLLKSRQYIGDTVALPERAISAIVLIAILTAFFLTVKRYHKALFAGLLSSNGIAWLTGLALFFAVTSKTVDGLARKLVPLGIELSQNYSNNLALYEEVAELGMALALLAAALIWLPKQHK